MDIEWLLFSVNIAVVDILPFQAVQQMGPFSSHICRKPDCRSVSACFFFKENYKILEDFPSDATSEWYCCNSVDDVGTLVET